MALGYIIKVNRGVKSLGTGESLTVEKEHMPTATMEDIASHMSLSNPLIPKESVQMYASEYEKTLLYFLSLGYKVPLFGSYGKSLATMEANVKLKDTMTLIQAKHPEITELTLENAKDLVDAKDIYVYVTIEAEKKLNEGLREKMEGLTRVDVKEVPYIE